MRRFLTGLLILVLAIGLLAGCNTSESATEPMGNVAHGEDGQKAETPDKEAAEETFEVPTGYPYAGKVYEFCLFHDGVLFVGEKYLDSLPKEAVQVGQIRSMDNDAIPDEELESTQLPKGMEVYSIEEGKTLLVKYDGTHLLKMTPYTGNTDDLFIPWWQRETSANGTQSEEPDIARLMREEVPSERLFTIALYPDVDRDFVIQRILEKYNVVLVLDGLSLKSFTVYSKDLLSDEEATTFLTEIAQEGGVLSVERPAEAQKAGTSRISYFKHGPEMMPVSGWDPNDPESAGKENPWTEHATLSEAEKAAGFTFEIPENDLQKIYRTMGQEIIEVIFLENGEEVYRLRKGVGYGNVSGDNRKFSSKGAGNLGGLDIFTFYGSMEEDPFETYRLAYRIYTDYSYSASFTKPMTGDEIVKLFPDDKHTRSEEDEIPNSRDVEWYMVNYKEGVTVLELPEEVMTRPPLTFPRQGENGREYSPETLIVKLDLTYNKEAVIQNILSRFPVELKYEFRMADSVIALKTTETLDDEAFAELAQAIYGMTGVLDVTRDPINQLDVVHETTVLSDI